MLSIDDVEAAADRIADHVHRTPLTVSATFSRMFDCTFHLKLECLQRTGSFKVRGATNKILSLPSAERERGVVAASAGNHAQGVALAARTVGVPCTIVMPEGASFAKVEATEGYGAEVVLHGEDYDAAHDHAVRLADKEGWTKVPAFDEEAVMAGQGTVGLEILEDLPDVDTVLCGVGGGGLISGIATAVKARRPETRVVGVCAAGADSLPRSLDRGEVVAIDEADTIADGLAARRIGERTFDVIRERVDDVVVVDDDAISSAILLLLERAKLVVEGAGAVGLAACLQDDVDVAGGEVACVLSGGNIDITLLDQILNRGLATEGRTLRFHTTLEDRPGQLLELLSVLATEGANVRSIDHDRYKVGLGVTEAWVGVDVETRGSEHAERLLAKLDEAGYDVVVEQ